MMNRLIMTCLCALVLVLTTGCPQDDNGGGGVDPMVEVPKVSISSLAFFEGNENNTVSFKVSTSVESDAEIRLNYTIEEGTAAIGTDFEANSGTLSIASGLREGFIDIVILADSLKEADETFKVILSSPVNATIVEEEGIGTIRNDDSYVFVPEDGYITPESYTGYDLVWSDEFEGASIDPNNWTHEMGNGNGGWGNQELQYYTNRIDNSFLSDGDLVIEAREENFSGSAYTSARMVSRNKQEFQYGRVDIRAILPEGQGIWPALWMLGINITDIGWPACGEIDIMELLGNEPEKIHGTAHWGPQGQSFSTFEGKGYTLNEGKFADEYHVFSIIWEPGSIKWLVDDEQYHSITTSNVNVPYPFDAEFFFILNVAVGGLWPGAPDSSTSFPQRMYVDYIRVFQEN